MKARVVGSLILVLAVASIVAYSAIAYTSAPTETELLGRYVLRTGGKEAVLMIKPDHTYVHTWYANGVLQHQTATWDFEGTVSEGYFSHCARVSFESFEAPGRDGFWPSCIGKSLTGRITIAVDEDLGLYYGKQ